MITGVLTADPSDHHRLSGHTGMVNSVVFGTDADGRLVLASGSDDETVRLWDPRRGEPIGAPWTGHTGKVNAVAFGADDERGPILASGSHDDTVRLWDPSTGRAIGMPLTGHTGPVWSVA